ncbi:transposase [Streptomyces sp. WA6-1-16]|nr:transposase [Streptomyces sp. WA6-1-16]UCA51149.1 transposase [Streptomyces sp. WA6-1-16]
MPSVRRTSRQRCRSRSRGRISTGGAGSVCGVCRWTAGASRWSRWPPARARTATGRRWPASSLPARGTRRMCPVGLAHAAGRRPTAPVIDDTWFLEGGDASACVARQCTGTAGKAADCRAGVSLHVASNGAWNAVNRRLFLPGSRDPAAPKADPAAAARRDKCALPARVGHAEKRRPASCAPRGSAGAPRTATAR